MTSFQPKPLAATWTREVDERVRDALTSLSRIDIVSKHQLIAYLENTVGLDMFDMLAQPDRFIGALAAIRAAIHADTAQKVDPQSWRSRKRRSSQRKNHTASTNSFDDDADQTLWKRCAFPM